jgi:lipid-A-disaccharide synthase
MAGEAVPAVRNGTVPHLPLDGGDLVVVLNGPGELSAWFHPFLAALRERAPDVRLTCALVPCVFASGGEGGVLRRMPGVDAVSEPRQTLRFALGGRLPDGWRPGPRGTVLHMGGDVILSVRIARRLGYTLLGYAERPLSFERSFERILLVHPLAEQTPRYEVIGDLMVDAARMRCPDRRPAPPERPTIGLFPGSRDYQAKHMVPFLTRVAGLVSSWLPGARWMLGRADYLSPERLRQIAADRNGLVLDSETSRWEDDGRGGVLVSEHGVRVEVRTAPEVMNRAHMVLTIPGSNTGELAALGVPMIVMIPSYYGEVHPAPGALGHLGRVPVLGRWMKRPLMHLWVRHLRYVSIPNRRSRRQLVPEMIGRLTPEEVAEAVRRLLPTLSDGRVAKELIATMGPAGAAGRLADAVLSALRSPVVSA